MSLYMQIPNIQGDVQVKGYEGWIELIDVDFGGVSNPTPMVTGKAMDRFNALPSFGQVLVTKLLDRSSPLLFAASHDIKVFPHVEIHYVQTGSQLFAYAKTTLSQVAVTHYSESLVSDDATPGEFIRFAYTRIERTFVPRGKDHQAGSPIITGYNLEQAEKL